MSGEVRFDCLSAFLPGFHDSHLRTLSRCPARKVDVYVPNLGWSEVNRERMLEAAGTLPSNVHLVERPIDYIVPFDPIKLLSGSHSMNSPFRFVGVEEELESSDRVMICELHPFYATDLIRRARGLSVPPIVTCESTLGLDLPRLPPYSRNVSRAVQSKAVFGAATRRAKEWLASIGVIKSRIADFPLANVDVGRFTQRGSYDKSVIEILFVGKLERHKGFEVLIRTLKSLARYLRFTLHVVGRGKLASLLTRDLGFVFKHDLFLAERDYVQAFERADVFCLPSTGQRILGLRVWEEVFGVAAYEAMASGLPLVVSDNGNLAELSSQGNPVVRAGDALGLREALYSLGRSGERREEIGRRNRAYAESTFSDKAVDSRWNALLELE